MHPVNLRLQSLSLDCWRPSFCFRVARSTLILHKGWPGERKTTTFGPGAISFSFLAASAMGTHASARKNAITFFIASPYSVNAYSTLESESRIGG